MEAIILSRVDLITELQSESFSGAISVVCDDRPLVEFAAGRTRLDSGEPIGMHTRFSTASITKMFTGACIARLVDSGICRFDQPATAYVPSLERYFGSNLTLELLLSHRAGLGDYIDDDAKLPFAGMPIEELTNVAAFLPYVVAVDRFEPGVFRYSGAGYLLLGLVIEAVTGRSYVEAIEEWVLEPAGLKSTNFGRTDSMDPDFAWGYLPDGTPNVDHLPPVGGPDGGIVTCVDDLRQFFTWMKQGQAISNDLRQRLWTPVSVHNDREAYGHGFDIITVSGRKWIGHTGSDPGVSARAVFALDSESSIIVLCNRSSIAFRVFRHTIAWLESQSWPPKERLQLEHGEPGA